MSEHPRTWPERYEPWMRLLFWVLVAAIAVFAARQLGPILVWLLGVLSPFLIALVLAYVLHPVVNFVQRRLKLGRTGGILVVALVALAIGVGLAAWLIPVLYQQLTAMLAALKQHGPRLIDRFADSIDEQTRQIWQQRIGDWLSQLDSAVRLAISQTGDTLKPVAEGSLQAAATVAGGVLRGLGAVGGLIGSLILVVIVTFYYLADMDAIPAVIQRMLPERHRDRIWTLALQADRAVGGFLRGQLTVCVCVAILVSAILFLIGLRQYAILIGCFAGVMNFIPYLGPVAGATPAILWALGSETMQTWGERGATIGMILGGFALVQAIDGLVFQPYIVGRHASLHPLAVILALAVGAQAGLGGMIVAVPVACIVKVLWMELFWKQRPVPEQPPQRKPRKSAP